MTGTSTASRAIAARGAAAAFAAAAVGLGACGSGDKPEPPPPARALVLQARDVPPGFSAFARGPVTHADGPRAGSRDDWRAAYKRAGTPRTRGPLVIASRVDVFAGARSAARDLARRAPAGRRLAGVRVGEDTAAAQLDQRLGPRVSHHFTIAWRQGEVTAALQVSGFRVTAAEAVALARRQQERIVRARAGTGARR